MGSQIGQANVVGDSIGRLATKVLAGEHSHH